MRRALDTKPFLHHGHRHCEIMFDDFYVLFGQHVDSSKYTNDYLRIIWEDVSWCIKNYINLPYVPCGLLNVVMALAVDAISYYKTITTDINDPDYDGGGIDISNIAKIQIGDTNVSLGGSTTSSDTITERGRALNSHVPNLDDTLFNFREQLNQYRSPIPWRR